MQVHAFYGKRLVIMFAVFMTVLYHISPIILDKILPLNESRPVMFPIDLEFLIDEEQHPILNTFLKYLMLIMDVTVIVGTESLMIMLSSHLAGLYEVASYYFEKAVLAELSAPYLPRDCSNYRSNTYIARGVILHRMARQFGHDASNQSKLSYIPAVIFGVIALSIHFFCLSQTVLQTVDIRETILSLLLIISTLGYMFWMNLAVEHIIEAVESISLRTYNTNWYETSIATQKLLQLIILNSNRGFEFNFMSVYTPSIEGFAVLLKTSVSYFTVLLSMQ
ncbi:uncharacterized protein LOC143264802 isoform X2 [Megachile rotundata]|uniref:uncharacterized protein LOC143264802 isoform X2 n=1 Tax=Megachile rotundata TaxID=143995 RepID=UPI003FCFC583